jgi:hypothetical protein
MMLSYGSDRADLHVLFSERFCQVPEMPETSLEVRASDIAGVMNAWKWQTRCGKAILRCRR